MKKTNKRIVKMAKPARTTKKTSAKRSEKRLTKTAKPAQKKSVTKVVAKKSAPKKVTKVAKKTTSKKQVAPIDSQYNVILNHLVKKGSINTMEAIKDYGVLRLGAVVHSLRQGGMNILTSVHTFSGKSGRNSNVAKYVLIP